VTLQIFVLKLKKNGVLQHIFTLATFFHSTKHWKILRDNNVKGLIVEHIISGFIEKMQKLLYRSKNY
jgi:hypothetical protein